MIGRLLCALGLHEWAIGWLAEEESPVGFRVLPPGSPGLIRRRWCNRDGCEVSETRDVPGGGRWQRER